MFASSIGSKVIAAAYAAFLIFLIAAAYREGLSHYYAATAFRSGLDADLAAAISYQPENPYAYRTEAEVRMRNKDHSAAIDAIQKAIAIRDGDYLLWLQLGYARQQLGELDAAAEAYQKSIDLAPNYSRPKYYMGMLLLDADRDEEAFEYLTKAAELDPELAPTVRRLARKSFDDPQAIEAALHPATPDAKRSVARYLIKYDYMTDSIRAFLLSDELSSAEKNEFVEYLLHKRKYQLAREVWLSRPGQDPAAGALPLYDGGFERITESDPSGLGWQIEQKMSAIAVTRDRENVHSGENSLNIRFAGGVDFYRPIVSQVAFINSGRRCTLVFYYRSTDIVSAGLPSIVVTDAVSNETIAASDPIADTKGEWIRGQLTFTAKNDPAVVISLQRPNCNTNPCPIFGNLSLDDISIVP